MNATLSKLQTVLDMAQAEGLITRNPVRPVKRLKGAKAVHKLWTDEAEKAFFELADQDRLAAVLDLFSRALRPEEVCGVRWDDISFNARTVDIGNHVRTMVEGEPIEKRAKTEAGIRMLPLDSYGASSRPPRGAPPVRPTWWAQTADTCCAMSSAPRGCRTSSGATCGASCGKHR